MKIKPGKKTISKTSSSNQEIPYLIKFRYLYIYELIPADMNEPNTVDTILQTHQLKRTSIRRRLLNLFMQQTHALSATDIETSIGDTHDRVTVYRTLHTFEEKGIIHKVPAEGMGDKFALCSRECPDELHFDDHVHFICEKCENTFCLEDLHIPLLELPKGFHMEHVSYTVKGTCELCR